VEKMTYSADFRQQVFLVKEKENLSLEQVANRFGMGKSTVFRWTKRLEAKRTRHKPATKIDADRLRKAVALYPDAYQYERAQRLGVIGYALKRLGMSRKKNMFPPKS
jgi:transposase-like protein